MSALTLLTMVFAAPAQAVTIEYNVAVDHYVSCGAVLEKSWGSGCYRQDGDYFWVTDDSSDDRSTGVIWRHPSTGREGICRNKDGFLGGGVRTCNKDFPENTKIRWRIARCDGSAHSCKSLSHWVDSSGVIEETT
ncbi:hypothetical protein ACFWEJ_09470 [Promicromonospora sp. NPDC060204]|uniref:hypothetical protein n=1 Tax=Promicromonospora sp. NPDC060204 TaxID=3347071 RepID=UPI003661A420